MDVALNILSADIDSGNSLWLRTENFVVKHATFIAVVAVALLLILIAFVFYRLDESNSSARAWVKHSREVLGHAEALLAEMGDAELSHGAYMMTGDEAILVRYKELVQGLANDGTNTNAEAPPGSLAEELKTLRHLIVDNPVQQKNLNGAAASLQELMGYLASILQSAAAGKTKIGAQAIDFEIRESLTRPIHNQLNAMIAEENRLLAEREQTEKTAALWSHLLISGGMAIFYIVVVFAIRLCQKAEKLAHAQFLRQREESEKTMRLMAAIVESSDEAIIGKALDGKINSWNAGAEKLFGYSADEVIGQPVSLLVPPERTHEEQRMMAEVREGRQVSRQETQRRAKNGNYIDVLATLSPIRDTTGKVAGVSTVAHDIRARKKAEEEIRHHVEALSRSNQELDDFAYIASHDLKEPLRGLTNNAMFLKEDLVDTLTPETTKRLDRMSYLCQRLERLVDDLLYFSRLGRQQLAIQRTDLNEIVNDIKLTMETTLREANAVIVLPTPLPTIICDLPRVTEVFRNLIVNAVKYNKNAEKRIEIGCAAGEKPTAGNDNSALTLYVRDNGIGIPEQFHNDIFRIFKRLNEEDEKVKGTGVGLTFVRKIIERHGGRIWLNSEVGKGTTFYFTLNTSKEAS